MSLRSRSGHDQFRTWWHFLPATAPLLAAAAALVGPRTPRGVAVQAIFVFGVTALIFGVAASGSSHSGEGLWPVGLVVVSTCTAAIATVAGFAASAWRETRRR